MGFRLYANSDGGLVNVVIQGSVVDLCWSTDEVMDVLGTLGSGAAQPLRLPL